jgi:hypothetical protein
MYKQGKENQMNIKIDTNVAKKAWVFIPVFLLAGLVSILIFNYHDAFSWQGILAGFTVEFLLFLLFGVFSHLV